jgi:cytochrome b
MANNQSVKVWDSAIRIFHWSLLACFIVAYLSGEEEGELHAWAGYVIAALLLFRLVWGFAGPEHARFTDFIYSPVKVLGYLRSLATGSPDHYLGHNPASGWMIVLLLLSLCFAVYSGLQAYAAEGHGPLANVELPSLIAETYAHDDEDDDDEEADEHEEEEEHARKGGTRSRASRDERRERHEREERHERDHDSDEYWEELHEVAVNFTLLLVVLHLLGVIAASRLHHENLIKAMITGKKPVRSA